VFNDEGEMWATLKHHREGKHGNDAVTLVYTESSSQRVSGHYSHGILHWNDGDTWEKSHGRHDDHGHDSHHHEDIVHDQTSDHEEVHDPHGTPDPPPELAAFTLGDDFPQPPTRKTHLVPEKRNSLHQHQPSTGDPFLTQDDPSISKTPTRTQLPTY